MGLNEEIQKHIKVTYLEPARRSGQEMIRIRAGDVHRDLHWVNRVPSVCTTLASRKFQRETGLELVGKEGPPSGNSTTVVFTYRLPSKGSATPQSEGHKNRLEELYGIAAGIFRELGGGENYLRKERARLHFRKDEKIKNDKGAR
jgi:hypothetical protein